MKTIVEELRGVAALKIGDHIPVESRPFVWAVSGLCGRAADEIERLRLDRAGGDPDGPTLTITEKEAG